METHIKLEFLNANQLEELTGTPASTWRYWAHIGSGPASQKIGRRRVWRRSTVLDWLAAQQHQQPRDSRC
jgi:prophage regulatory protein